MWYEVLPSFAIMFAALAAPTFIVGGVNYIMQNKKVRGRDWEIHPLDFHMYLRDRRITGSEFIPKGLEAIKENE